MTTFINHALAKEVNQVLATAKTIESGNVGSVIGSVSIEVFDGISFSSYIYNGPNAIANRNADLELLNSLKN